MRKKRILTVDDETGFVRLLKLGLERTGDYWVREEHDPRNAVDVAKQFQPDLILLDVMMPQMHGCDVATQIRSCPSLQETPIVYLTAAVLARGAEGSPRIDGCMVLAKSIGLNELIEAIEENLSVAVFAD